MKKSFRIFQLVTTELLTANKYTFTCESFLLGQRDYALWAGERSRDVTCVGAIHLHLHIRWMCALFAVVFFLSVFSDCIECNNSAPTGRILYYTLSKWWMDDGDVILNRSDTRCTFRIYLLIPLHFKHETTNL